MDKVANAKFSDVINTARQDDTKGFEEKPTYLCSPALENIDINNKINEICVKKNGGKI